jgi:hypothetical protein
MGLALLISLIGSPEASAGSSVIEQAQEERTLAPPTEGLDLPSAPVKDINKN